MIKNRRFGMVFTERDQQILKQMAQELGLSISTFVRLLIREKAIEKGLWPSQSDNKNDSES